MTAIGEGTAEKAAPAEDEDSAENEEAEMEDSAEISAEDQYVNTISGWKQLSAEHQYVVQWTADLEDSAELLLSY